MFQMYIKANGQRPYPARHLPEDAASDCAEWVEEQAPEMIARLQGILNAGDHWKAKPDDHLFWSLRSIYADQCHPDAIKCEAISHLWSLVDIDPAA